MQKENVSPIHHIKNEELPYNHMQSYICSKQRFSWKLETVKGGLSYRYLGKYSTLCMKITENESKKLTVYLSEAKLNINISSNSTSK